MISLTADEVYKRFGVKIAIENFPSQLTEAEEQNAKTVINYMEVSYLQLFNVHKILC